MRETWRVFEQFEQIARRPTWSGDLISKDMTAHLRRAKLIRWKQTGIYRGSPEANRNGGYVLTWRGRLVWWLWQGRKKIIAVNGKKQQRG